MRELPPGRALPRPRRGLALAAREIAARGRVPLYEQPALGIATLEASSSRQRGGSWRCSPGAGRAGSGSRRRPRSGGPAPLPDAIPRQLHRALRRADADPLHVVAGPHLRLLQERATDRCSLGLGLGCFLARGNARHARSFLLWTIPVAVALSAAAAGEQCARQAGGDRHQRAHAGRLRPPGGRPHPRVASSPDGGLLRRHAGRDHAAVRAARVCSARPSSACRGAATPRTSREAWRGSSASSASRCSRRRRRSGRGRPRPLAGGPRGRATRRCCSAGGRLLRPAVGRATGTPSGRGYQKLVGHEVAVGGGASGYLVEISDVFYQVAVDRRPEASPPARATPSPLRAPLRQVPRPGRVLVGRSRDRQRRRRGAPGRRPRVDAVDIDPASCRWAAFTTRAPYDDPRVRVVVDDARHAFRVLPPASYDLVVFGLLDSHTSSACRACGSTTTCSRWRASARRGPAGAGRTHRGDSGGLRAVVRAAPRDHAAAATGGGVDVRATATGRRSGLARGRCRRTGGAARRSAAERTGRSVPARARRARRVPWVVGAMALASLLVLRLAGLPFARFAATTGTSSSSARPSC